MCLVKLIAPSARLFPGPGFSDARGRAWGGFLQVLAVIPPCDEAVSHTGKRPAVRDGYVDLYPYCAILAQSVLREYYIYRPNFHQFPKNDQPTRRGQRPSPQPLSRRERGYRPPVHLLPSPSGRGVGVRENSPPPPYPKILSIPFIDVKTRPPAREGPGVRAFRFYKKSPLP